MLSLYVLQMLFSVYVFHCSTFLLFQSSLVISPATIFPPPPPLASTRLHTHTEFTQSTHINQLNEDLQIYFWITLQNFAGITLKFDSIAIQCWYGGSWEVRLPESQFSFNLVIMEARKPDLFQRMISSEVGPRPTQE